MLMFDVAHPIGSPAGVFGRWHSSSERMRHSEEVKTVVPVTVFVDVIVVEPDTYVDVTTEV